MMRKILGGMAIFVGMVMFLISALLLGCVPSSGPSVVQEATVKETTKVTYDMDAVITLGNRSYIPINQYGKPGDNPSLILNVLAAFEKKHPHLEIIDWKIEKQQEAWGEANFIYGIWVDWREKAQSP